MAGLALDTTSGKVVVSGGAAASGANPRLAVARLNVNGTLDTTFSGDGKAMTDLSTSAVSDYANAVVSRRTAGSWRVGSPASGSRSFDTTMTGLSTRRSAATARC